MSRSQIVHWVGLRYHGLTKVPDSSCHEKAVALPCGQGASREITLQNRSLNFTGAQLEKVNEMKVTAVIKVSRV